MRIVNKKKFKTSIRITIIFLFLIFVVMHHIITTPKYNESYEKIYIYKNDTLWDIAEKYKKPSQDKRDYIHKIMEINNMTSATIYDGQELTIIKYEEVK